MCACMADKGDRGQWPTMLPAFLGNKYCYVSVAQREFQAAHFDTRAYALDVLSCGNDSEAL